MMLRATAAADAASDAAAIAAMDEGRAAAEEGRAGELEARLAVAAEVAKDLQV